MLYTTHADVSPHTVEIGEWRTVLAHVLPQFVKESYSV